MEKHYREHEIEPKWFPIHDFNADDLKAKILEGAHILNDLINEKGKTVYVHCTAGMGRAPAVVVTYLCIYYGMDPEYGDRFVKSYRSVSAPNLPVIKAVVEGYKR